MQKRNNVGNYRQINLLHLWKYFKTDVDFYDELSIFNQDNQNDDFYDELIMFKKANQKELVVKKENTI